MNDQEKKAYDEEYHEAKEKGVPFFPDILFKDAVVVLIVFVILVALAYFVGAPLEARANPGDATYTPRPEWYFLFLFQLLKYFPGRARSSGWCCSQLWLCCCCSPCRFWIGPRGGTS